MAFANKIIVAVDFNNEIPHLLEDLKQLNIPNECELHFVHMANKITYSFVFSTTPLVYPIDEDRKTIEEDILINLKKLSRAVLPESFKGKVEHHCFFSENPKIDFAEYVNTQKADLVVVATRERKGFFESSFAQYVDRHTRANMLLIKHR